MKRLIILLPILFCGCNETHAPKAEVIPGLMGVSVNASTGQPYGTHTFIVTLEGHKYVVVQSEHDNVAICPATEDK